MESFYKYCPISSHDNLEEQHSLINLFENQASFSRRKNFNDLFDSKVKIIRPSRDRVRRTYQKLSGESKRTFKNLYMGENANHNFDILIKTIEEILDSYLFYCVTDNPINNLMWSHYASSHNGFCIEWNGDEMSPEKVRYQDQLPTLELLELLESTIGLRTKDEIASQAWVSLKIKLQEWEYESEYRINLSNRAQNLIVKDLGKLALVKFQPEWIKSIIFGYRMPEKTRDYIRRNMPVNTTYQEAVISRNGNGLALKKMA
ncbi:MULTISPECIES: DUF2971 domain-containing protein [Vibrio]|uniref:DUF2971 domain-containing protein n=1 Tax=Vibrio TaxID=662 RepID=UPI00208A7250|nr:MULTISPECIES: DUF2971 domain-containing protein [unclassified Vibrio]MDQ2110035.1 DUF2971 domain-containing protein [Vibrio sp. 2017_1457_15]MDQ2162845.1 DUF2971 domain-containing protein [Vibrio sp. 2017_1457_13]GHX27490.1 hypothetical protein VCSRO61_3345 [Vibrio cholerae]